MNTDFSRSSVNVVTDVYTDLNGMSALRAEKDDDVALKKVAQQFESMFISLLLKNMRSANAVFSEGGMFDSQESKFYQDMQDDQMSLTLAHGEGFGIAEAMYRQMSNAYGGEKSSPLREVQQARASAHLSLLQNPETALESSSAQSTEMSVADSEYLLAVGGGDNGRIEIAASPQEFVAKVEQSAHVAAQVLGIDKEVLIAQAALETGWGKFVLASDDGDSSFNMFNIKADQRWNGDAVEKSSLEFLGGKFSTLAAKFRSYGSIEESFNDFTQFIQHSERYQDAAKIGGAGMGFIKSIHQSGYATDPKYVEKIASVYDRVKSIISGQSDSGVEQ